MKLLCQESYEFESSWDTFFIRSSITTPATHASSKHQKPAKNETSKNRELDTLYLFLQQFDKF